MDSQEAVNAVYHGRLVECDELEYPTIRGALQDYAGRSIDAGDGLRASIALQEVKRLDKKFNFQLGSV